MFACSCESINNVTRCSSMNELVDDPGAGLGEGGVCFCGCLRFWKETSFPYFGVKLSCVCLMIAYRKKLPKVTQR